MMAWGDAISLGQHHYQHSSHRFPGPVLALCSTLGEGNLGRVRRRRSAISTRVLLLREAHPEPQVHQRAFEETPGFPVGNRKRPRQEDQD